MAQGFAPRLDILPELQRRLWDELAGVPAEFVLYGGTAIALHLGHRQSEGFDFFGSERFDPAKPTTSIPFMASATIAQRSPNTLSGIVERGGPVRVSFFGVSGMPTVLAAARAIYGTQFNPQITLKALSYFEDGTVRRLPQATKDRLAKAAREVDLDRLPTIDGTAPSGGNDDELPQ